MDRRVAYTEKAGERKGRKDIPDKGSTHVPSPWAEDQPRDLLRKGKAVLYGRCSLWQQSQTKMPIGSRPVLDCMGVVWVSVSFVLHTFIHAFTPCRCLPPPHPVSPGSWGHSPHGPCVPALAGGADLSMEVFLELQAGIRCVPLEGTDRWAFHPAKLQLHHQAGQ